VSDAPTWVAVGVSVVALVWTAWIDYRTRQEERNAAARQEQAAIDGAISRVVAQWTTNRRLKEGTWPNHQSPEELKKNLVALSKSASRLRRSCIEPLAIVPKTLPAHGLITKTVEAVSEFEGVIDRMLKEETKVNGIAIQDAMAHMKETVGESIEQLNALRGSSSQGDSLRS
jgi:hypothetical protein